MAYRKTSEFGVPPCRVLILFSSSNATTSLVRRSFPSLARITTQANTARPSLTLGMPAFWRSTPRTVIGCPPKFQRIRLKRPSPLVRLSTSGRSTLRIGRHLFATVRFPTWWINEQIRAVWSIFKHGVSAEWIEWETYHKLTTLEPLKRGQTTAREQQPRDPALLSHMAATVAELTPPLAAMIRIQLATGMRSGEVCRIRPCDIDQTGEEWIDRQDSHKRPLTTESGKPFRLSATPATC